jgi:hypothetical protein
MSERAENSTFFRLVAFGTILVIGGALFLAGAAILENVRFARATNNILILVNKARQIATTQPTFAIVPGVNIADALLESLQIKPEMLVTPWGDSTSLVSLNNSMMRYEAELPTRNCRRLALYLLAQRPTELGLLTIEAQPRTPRTSQTTPIWVHIFPEPAGGRLRGTDMVVPACGMGETARVGLTFRFR